MSDQIPVGSPPVPPGRHAAPGGWYADPTDPARERYWDGWQWSRQTREAAAPSRPTGLTTQTGTTGVMAGEPTGRGPGTPAGWWQRVLAVLIDWVLLTVVTSVLLAPIYLAAAERLQPLLERMVDDARRGVPSSPLDPQQWITQSEQFTVAAVTLTVSLLYHVLLVRFRGATLGKNAAGVRIVAVAPTGAGAAAGPGATTVITWRTAIVRAVVWVVPGQTACLWPLRVLDVLLPLRHPRRQALHDLAAATQVVRTR